VSECGVVRGWVSVMVSVSEESVCGDAMRFAMCRTMRDAHCEHVRCVHVMRVVRAYVVLRVTMCVRDQCDKLRSACVYDEVNEFKPIKTYFVG
jgi:hypothetical protein